MTTIEWTDVTWNPIRGCSIVSRGCEHCYAMNQAHRFSGEGMPYHGLTRMTPTGPKWTGAIRLLPELLEKPLKWKKPRRVFVNSMSDLFHEDVPFDFIAHVFTVMALTPQHTYQILTKRPARMLEYLTSDPGDRWNMIAGTMMHWDDMPEATDPLSNVWLGVSAEDQATADERIPILLDTPAAVRWVSAEPLLGPIDHRQMFVQGDRWIDWLVLGGESGPGARPMREEWARDIRDQCIEARVPFFLKQLGGVRDKRGHDDALLDGVRWQEYPQQVPA